MPDYSLVPVDYQPDFSDVSLVPVDHDPFGADDITQQAQAQPAQIQSQPAQPQPQSTGRHRVIASNQAAGLEHRSAALERASPPGLRLTEDEQRSVEPVAESGTADHPPLLDDGAGNGQCRGRPSPHDPVRSVASISTHAVPESPTCHSDRSPTRENHPWTPLGQPPRTQKEQKISSYSRQNLSGRRR